MNKEQYRSKACQFNNRDTYHTLPHNPTKVFKKELVAFLPRGVNIGAISNIQQPITPIFHHLLKIHKSCNTLHGCLIVAGIGSLLEKLGTCVDLHLEPLVISLLGYICDTSTKNRIKSLYSIHTVVIQFNVCNFRCLCT